MAFHTMYQKQWTEITFNKAGKIVRRYDNHVIGSIKRRPSYEGWAVWVAKADTGEVGTGRTRDEAAKALMHSVAKSDEHEHPEIVRKSGGARVLIKWVYGGEYDARGSWDMVYFGGANHYERCGDCFEEIRGCFNNARTPNNSPAGSFSYFQVN